MCMIVPVLALGTQQVHAWNWWGWRHTGGHWWDNNGYCQTSYGCGGGGSGQYDINNGVCQDHSYAYCIGYWQGFHDAQAQAQQQQQNTAEQGSSITITGNNNEVSSTLTSSQASNWP
jgi:hypothetical protein